jgi:hypothetical protein
MANRWVEFVRKWAKDNNMNYMCAMTTKECKNAYLKAHPKTQTAKTKMKAEQTSMAMEDTPAPASKIDTAIERFKSGAKIKVELQELIAMAKKGLLNKGEKTKLEKLVEMFNTKTRAKRLVPKKTKVEMAIDRFEAGEDIRSELKELISQYDDDLLDEEDSEKLEKLVERFNAKKRADKKK